MDNMFTHNLVARPSGVTFIAVMTNIAGLVTIAVAGLGLFGFTSPQTQAANANPPVAIAILIMHGLLGVAYVIVASGLWRLRPWAFWAAIALSLLLVANYVFSFWQRYLTTPLTEIGIALPVFILLYFALNRTARHAFGVGV